MQNENLDITEQKKPASRMKYLQLVDYINSLIEDGTLQIGDQIRITDRPVARRQTGKHG